MEHRKKSVALAALVMAIGTLISATTAPSMRFVLNTGMPPLQLAFLRAAFAAAGSLVITLGTPALRGELRALPRKSFALLVLAGAMFGGHYAMWVPALSYTTTFAAGMLASVQPLFVFVGAWLLLHERTPLKCLIGAGMALLGVVLIGVGEMGGSAPNALLGNMLAIGTAVFGAGYTISARKARAHVSLMPFLAVLFTTASVVLFALTAATTGFAPLPGGSAGGLLFWLGLACTLGTHGGWNYALRYIETSTVAIVGLFEPVGASLLSWALFGEALGWPQLLSAALIVGGIAVYLYFAAAPRAVPAASAVLSD